MEHTASLKAILTSPRRIAITTHQKPDGDAIGSSLGLYHYLTRLGHQVDVVSPTDFPDFFRWLNGSQNILVGPADPVRANWAFEGADLIFCLDFNALDRINEFEKSVQESDAQKVMIDHHLDPPGFEDLRFWDPKASSTAEMVYRLILDMGDEQLLDQDMAEALYTGVLTDTGSFRFTSTTPAVHLMIARLLEAGAEPNKIHDAVFGNSTQERLRFLGHCLANCLHVLPEYRAAYLKVGKEVFKQFNVRTGDTEGLVNYALGIKDVDLGVLFTTQDDLVKISFRSRNEVSAKAFAEQFEGGGHFYASGGRSKTSLEETEAKFIELLKAHKAQGSLVKEA